MIARGLFGGQIVMTAIPPRQSIGSSNCGLRSVARQNRASSSPARTENSIVAAYVVTGYAATAD